MTWRQIVLVPGLILVAAYILRDAVRRVLDVMADGVHGVLSELLDAVDQARAGVARFCREQLGDMLGVRSLVGAVPLVAMALVLVWADFIVTVATIKSLLPVEPEQWTVSVRGYAIGVAESSALALVGLHFLAGFALVESLQLTRFFPLERLLSPVGIRRLRAISLVGLVVLGGISAGLAAWRTEQLQAVAAIHHEESLPGGWTERLPRALMPILGFIIPVAGAFAGLGFYFASMGVLAALGLGVMGALLTLSLLLRLLRRLLAWAFQLMRALYDLLVAPGLWLVSHIRAAWTAYRDRTARAVGGTPHITS